MIIDNSDFYILHGEDDSCDMRIMQRYLDKMDYKGTYLQASLGQEVLEKINDLSQPKLPDLLILDIGLPGINGKEILSLIRADERTMGIPIMMMSGSNSQRDNQECIARGANVYIQKSGDPAELQHIVKCFIEGFVHVSAQEFI
jgi:CheY-like chemotaxis protein